MTTDRMEITVRLVSLKRDYKTAVLGLHQQTGRLKESLVACGIERDELLTDDYSVEQKHEYDRQEKTNTLIGYEAVHKLTVAMPFSRVRLGDILRAIGKAGDETEVTVEFLASNKRQYEQALLTEAYRNAQQTALTLATVSGHQLGSPLEINAHDDLFSYSTYSFERNQSTFCAARGRQAIPDPDIEPKTTQMKCQLSVSWLLD